MTRIAGMDVPAAMAGLTVADELVVHGWDVARASGQPYCSEPELLDAARSFLVQFASPDAPAGPDVPFGPSRQLPDEAPLLDRVVALAGRDPAGHPADDQTINRSARRAVLTRSGRAVCSTRVSRHRPAEAPVTSPTGRPCGTCRLRLGPARLGSPMPPS